MRVRLPILLVMAAILFLPPATVRLRADQVQMQNGDRYVGKVLSVTADTLVIQSEMLGKVSLPRAKVVSITLGAAPVLAAAPAPTNRPANVPQAALANTNDDLSAALRSLGANTNFIQQVQGQILGDAGPDANKKYNELVGGLMSGKLNLNDIRNEAKSSADQLRQLKHDLGPEAGDSLDAYLDILDNFLKETGPNTPAVKAGTSAVPQPNTSPQPQTPSKTDLAP